MFDLTITRLDFTVEAKTPIEMGDYKGSALRGAWHSYMQKAYCGAPPHARADPMHQALCPVCYLTNRETGSESRRPYALIPPLDRTRRYEAGDAFHFSFSLFGNAAMLFPYVLLAVREVGETTGMGSFLPEQGGRGRYGLRTVQACEPHTGQTQILFDGEDGMAKTPTIQTNRHCIHSAAERLLGEMKKGGGLLKLELLTPLRLTDRKHLMHRFEFPIFFQRLLERLYALAQHFSPHPERYQRQALIDDVARLLPLARQVRVIQDDAIWWDVKGYSGRKGGVTYLGGLVGEVQLDCADWTPLLPYLLWGSSAQLGKNVVKGGGYFRLEAAPSSVETHLKEEDAP